MSALSADVQWQAVVSCDKAYDGMFYYAVKTTGIFCKPSCRAKTPLRGHVLFFRHRDEAIAACFRPCKRCRPDLLVYEPERELIKRAKELMALHVASQEPLRDMLSKLGISQSYMNNLFQKYVHVSPKQYWTKLRIEHSARLLVETDISIMETAMDSGFRSLSSFYRCFKEQMGTTPLDYRKQRR